TEKSRLLNSASSYFDLANSYIRSRPALVITTGFVGTGKTALAQAVARRLGLVAISSDVTRKRLASIPLTEHHFEEFDTGIYSTEATRKTYDKMFSEAKSILTEGGSVILDASFIKSQERQTAKRLAEEADADFFIVECTLDEAIIRERLDKRMKEGSASDGRWEILEPQKKHFKPVTEASPANHIKVNMASSPDKLAKEVAARIAN
ncbi:MAG: AAA family ATPase, partial [Dehalococcoidia bacterium]|nr:AAA family ATPase [Dehalococcoidia bacterium]